MKIKRILLSVFTIAAVGGLAVGAARSFFSDVETSTENKLTAGEIDLKIDSTAHYDGMVCQLSVDPEGYFWADENGDPNDNPRPELIEKPCDGTWNSTDLTSQKFFNLSDIKPGDEGENTLSLTVGSNNAYACILIHNMQNLENACVEPESDAKDITCDTGPDQGELAQNIYFTAWVDDGDNVWEKGETLLFTNFMGPASDVLNGRIYTLADGQFGTPLVGETTSYIGLGWCAGTMAVDQINNVITCNGAGMGNNTQTDSVTADLSFYIEQVRNNPNFDCDQVPFPAPRPQ